MEKLEKRKLYVLGDIHGNFNIVKYYSATNNLKNTDIIQVGDFGIGFYQNDLEKIKELNKSLSLDNNRLYIIRGNHDDPSWFESSHLEFSHTSFLKDYTLLKLDIGNVFCVGGAISIDRQYRMRNELGYWSNELFKLYPHLIPSAENEKIDIVITHTAPTYCFPIGVNSFVKTFAYHDPTLLSELQQERELVDRLFDLIKEKGHEIKSHYYGHFHDSNTDYINNIKHRVLGVDEFLEVV